jgi:hypothetical protein
MSNKETRKSEELLRRENDELNEEVGVLKRKVEELDGRVAELEERERGKDEGVCLLLVRYLCQKRLLFLSKYFLLRIGEMSSIGNTSKGITQQGDRFFQF